MELLLALQDARTPVLDAVFLLASRLGEEVAVLSPLLLFYWCLDKRTGLRIGFTYFAGGLMGQFAKVIFRVERPFVRNPQLLPHPGAVEGATGYSFPSGHTTSATSLAAAFALNWRKKAWVWVVGAAYVALVGFSRLYLGVHTPMDVLCALALSFVMALVVDAAFADCEKRPGHVRLYFALCAVLALAMLACAQVLVSVGLVPENQAADAFKTGGAALALLLGVYLENKYVRFDVRAPLGVQAWKLVAGVLMALTIKEGLKIALGTSLPMQFLRYFLTVLFVVAGYPWLFSRMLKRAA